VWVLLSRAFSFVKWGAGLAISALLSVSYAMAFANTHGAVVYGAMAASFVLLTAPIWMSLSGHPMRRLIVYYVFVAVILFLVVMARFTVEAIVR
jgi:hypothetical protein